MMAEFKVDLLHLISGYLITGSVLREAHALGVPSAVSVTDFWFLCRRISFLRSDKSLSTLPLDPRRCARCVAEEQRRFSWPAKLAPGLTARWWQRESGCSPDKIVFMRQGRDFPQLDELSLAKTPSPRLRIGVLGQVIYTKGVHVAVEAMRHLPAKAVELHIHGGGADPGYYRRLQRAAAEDDRVTLHGAYQASKLTELMRSIDMLLIPSIWYENSPNVILEAFAHRTPVLGSKLGGMAELVRHDIDGLTFTPGDSQDLARQISRVIDQPSLLQKFRDNIPPVRTVAQEIDELEVIYRRHTGAA